MGQMDTSMQTQALTTIAAGPFHIFRFLLLPGLKLKHSCIKSRQSDQLMVSCPVCQISLLTALNKTLESPTAVKPEVCNSVVAVICRLQKDLFKFPNYQTQFYYLLIV